jgi:Catalytic LigB subunit of aromatic ring-opening dioxygenase
MAEIMGLGTTHAPTLWKLPEEMTSSLRRTLAGKNLAAHMRDPRNWPEGMRVEWADDCGTAAGREYNRRCFAATRELRARLDAFKPDLVIIYGDDQYENFVEDIVPPFCIYIVDEMHSLPYAAGPASPKPRPNVWNEPGDASFKHNGNSRAGRYLINYLRDQEIHMPYAYRLRYQNGLAHSFINTLLFLDPDRKGFDYPVVPIHINCYGGDLIRQRGGTKAPTDVDEEPDPSAPSAAACFDIGRAIGRAMAASPWRTAIIGSASWGHGFLTEKNHWLYPDHPSDRKRLAELKENRLAEWRNFRREELEGAGQHELTIWCALAGAMSDLDKKPEVIDYIETFTLNTDSCFAVFS